MHNEIKSAPSPAAPAPAPAAPAADAASEADVAHQLDQPIFLCGCVRSGTTMLRLILQHHPRIVGGHEFPYVRLCAEGENFIDTESFRQKLVAFRPHQQFGLTVNPDLDTPGLIRDFVRQMGAEAPQNHLLVVLHHRFDLMLRLFPNARFIHIIRDPRDVARSCIPMGWVGNVYYGADVWLTAEKEWEAIAPKLRPDQVIEIRFRDLLANVNELLTQICNFVGVGFDERMFDYVKNTTYDAPDPNLVDQWRRKLSPAELSWVEARCGDMMVARGYKLFGTGAPLPLPTRAYLALQNRLYRVLFNYKRFGLGLYLQYQISRRFGGSWYTSVRNRMNAIERQHLK
ncbi:MAG: sulfotransferase [Planctomycetes bacterium]|nr:sulfotransferase [Planctomycetota bacterium]